MSERMPLLASGDFFAYPCPPVASLENLSQVGASRG